MIKNVTDDFPKTIEKVSSPPIPKLAFEIEEESTKLQGKGVKPLPCLISLILELN